jgi:hypothetical protein
MKTSKVRSCCPPESADLTMDALQKTRYSAGRGIRPLRRATSRSLRCSHPRRQSAARRSKPAPIPNMLGRPGSAERATTRDPTFRPTTPVRLRPQITGAERGRRRPLRTRAAHFPSAPPPRGLSPPPRRGSVPTRAGLRALTAAATAGVRRASTEAVAFRPCGRPNSRRTRLGESNSARPDRALPAPQHATAIPPNPLAPIRVGRPLDRRGGRRALRSAFDPIGASGAPVQTRDPAGDRPRVHLNGPSARPPTRPRRGHRRRPHAPA